MCMMQGYLTPPEVLGKASERTIERALAHAGATLENQNAALIGEEARRVILNNFTDFLWVDRDGSGTCTACGIRLDDREFIATHKQWIQCPECGKRIQARWLSQGRKKLREEFYAVEWRKSAIERDALVMIGIYCGFDCRGGAPQLEEKVICPVLLDVFRYGKDAVRFQRSVWGWDSREPGHEPWVRRRDVRALGTSYFGRRVDIIVSPSNFAQAIAETPFASGIAALEAARAAHGAYVHGDRSEDVAAIAKRPWIEYMAKAGFRRIAADCVYAMPRGAINERRRSVREILKLTPDRYAALKGRQADISVDVLRLIQTADADGCRLSLEEIEEIERCVGGWHGIANVLEQYGKIDRTLVRFFRKAGYEQRRTLMDYLQACREIGADLSTPEARIPPNLEEAHDRAVAIRNETRYTARRVQKEQEYETMQSALDKRLPMLEKKYCFEHDGLVLRPARRLIELIDEGNALSHCVGGYVASYADGRTDICFLRKVEESDKPWRTVEFDPNSGRLIQDRGFANDRALGHGDKGRMDDALRATLDAFWAAFAEWTKAKGRKTA